MGRAKNLLPVIESDFRLIEQLLDFSVKSVYGDKGMPNSVKEIYNTLRDKYEEYRALTLSELNEQAENE